MSRDPFFDAIVRGLEAPLDPQLFEACVVDMLSGEWPGLVPVPGGSDGGMDGAVADGGGTPFPLVTTTARPKDIASNLKRNLKAFRAKGGVATKTLLALSRTISGTSRHRLTQLAAALGFQLVQIYDQAALATLLYRSPRWTKELLGLTYAASALSRVPTTSRPVIGRQAIGREEEVQWLRDGIHDRVLVGQPGSGKTFLLHLLAEEGYGLFLSSTDRNHVAEAIRECRPAAVFVDDAHADPSRLRALAQLRKEICADFAIVATTWPSGRGAVEEALGTAPSASLELRRLGRDQMVQVVAAAGINAPNELVREVVDQAEGRPGLAVTLAHMCLRGAGEDVVTGAVLRRSISSQFSEPSAADILATIALTGDDGANLDDVASVLELSRISARQVALTLAAGGVLFDHDGRLTVRPVRLRHGLIKDVFFGSVPYPLRRVVEGLRPSSPALASALIGALHVGASVDEDDLRRLIVTADRGGLWRDYAWHSPDAARWCLDQAPDRLTTYVQATLAHIPDLVLPHLLHGALGSHEAREHQSIRTIRQWIESARPGVPDAMQRRRVLIDAAAAFADVAAGLAIALEALRVALHPGFESHESDPGRGRTVTMRFGILPERQLQEVADLWGTIRAAVVGRPITNWAPLLSLAEDWAYPGRHARSGVSEPIHRLCSDAAAMMLRDLCEWSHGRPGVSHVVQRIASNAQLDVAVPRHHLFDLVYPQERFDVEGLARQTQQVIEAAGTLRDQGCTNALGVVVFCEREAADAGITYPRFTPDLCRALADAEIDFSEWATEARRLGLPADCSAAFIDGLVGHRPREWRGIIAELLNEPQYATVAAASLVQAQDVPADLLARAVQVPWNRMWLYSAAVRATLSPEALDALLADPRDYVAGMAAAGAWATAEEPRRPAIMQALMRCPPDEYVLGEILEADEHLGFRYAATLLASSVRIWDLPRALDGALKSRSDATR